MPGVEVIGHVLELYPATVALAENYKEMKGSGSAELSRKAFTAATMYDQTARALLASAVPQDELQTLVDAQGPESKRLWESPVLRQKLAKGLGSRKLRAGLSNLSETKTLLDEINTELTNMCRGTEVLDKIRSAERAATSGLPQRGIQDRMVRIKTLNKELRRLLDDRPFVPPHQRHRNPSDVEVNFSSHEPHSQDVVDIYEAIQEAFVCGCANAHVTSLGCHCAACSQPFTRLDPSHAVHGWEFVLALSRNPSHHSGSGPAVLLESSCKSAGEAPSIRDLCSLASGDGDGSQSSGAVVNIVGTSRTFQMEVKRGGESDGAKSGTIRCFSDLIQPGNGLSTKDRLELALRLSSAIVQLCRTPWLDSSWSWNDVCVSQADEGTGVVRFSSLLVPREFHSARHSADTSADTDSSAFTEVNVPAISEIVDEEPILTKLGLALIELALGETMADHKKRYGYADMHDSHMANICAAKKLIVSRRLRKEVSKDYEDVVTACVCHQYSDQEGRLKGLVLTDDSFMSKAREAIISPLFEVWRRYDS